jgi:transposase
VIEKGCLVEWLVHDTSEWQEAMDKEQRRQARAQLVARMHEGQSWQEVAAATGIHISQSTAYRLSQAVRKRGKVALQDGRHGHPIKLRGEARIFLEDYCRATPGTPSSI